MINIRNLIKKLIMLDVFFGRRSKIHHGIKDSGSDASLVDDPSKARSYKGSTIYNVNELTNEPNGGHFHDPSITLNDMLTTITANVIVDNSGNIVHK